MTRRELLADTANRYTLREMFEECTVCGRWRIACLLLHLLRPARSTP
jgi:hypothetical protein